MKREESCEQINISVCLRGRFPQLLWWELRIEAAAVLDQHLLSLVLTTIGYMLHKMVG